MTKCYCDRCGKELRWNERKYKINFYSGMRGTQTEQCKRCFKEILRIAKMEEVVNYED